MSSRLMNLLLLSLVVMVTSTSATVCNFPSYLQHDGNPSRRWMYRVHNQGARGASTHLYIITFDDDVMDIEADISAIDPPETLELYRRQCVLTKQNGIIVSQEYETATEEDSEGNEIQTSLEFLCIQFYRVSEYVVLIAEGDVTNTWSNNICEGPLTNDSWPMVSFSIESNLLHQSIPDELAGGYKFFMRNPNNGYILCSPGLFESSRMEVDCLPDQDMRFVFSKDCDIQSLKMDEQQHVYSLGTWIQDRYRFMVLKKINSMNLWCLRIPNGNNLEAFEGELYLDLECTTDNEQSNYLEMHFKRRVYDNLCDDISDNCVEFNETTGDVCINTENQNACLKFCDNCTPLMSDVGPQTYCKFPTTFQGAWIHVSQNERRAVRVSTDKMYIQGDNPLYCLPTTHNLTSRFPLMFSSTNGCFPRLTCVEFIAQNPGYVTYTIAATKYWPHDMLSLADPYDIVCNDAQFSGYYNQLMNHYSEPSVQSLVFDPRRPASDRRGANCSIGNTTLMHFMKLQGVGGKSCSGLFSISCSDPSIIEIMNSDCETTFVESSTYQCMSSLQVSGGRWIIVTVSGQSQDSELEDLTFHCWMFSSSLKALYLLPWADCNEETFNNIDNTDMYRNDVYTYITSVFKDSCEEPTTEISTDEPTTVTVRYNEDTTSWAFPDPIGVASYPCAYCYVYLGLCVLFVVVVFL